ncbi:MAG: LPP20 family lipoprotein [Acidaminococcaceae bacterium]|nr:LPP20 family lipoprotein [Acidaminococcaceae bacterium]
MATCTSFAQDVVSLVVSGEGKDKNEATQNALRSAIEQTFGTFVSANTTILNDQLVADEVVSLSSGNIKKYNYITENRLPNGNSYVTLSVEVALKKLVSYAKSKGSECEFAGATFGANVKQYKFYLESSRKVLNNLRLQCVEMAPFLYDYELEVGEPQMDGTVEFTVKVLANENTKIFGDLIINTLEAIEFDSIYAKQLEAMGVKTVAVSFHARGGFLKKYEL